MTEAEQVRLQALVDKFIADASEFCDSVRVFGTIHDGPTDSTDTFTDGGGNLYAQHAQVREWLIQQDEISRLGTPTKEEDDP
ncbi:MAG: hypothetical protein PHQ12_07515 [Chthoniobacteraceae bacterium]|nr:hypothetical protein [Chthoniobacteraceae bacterium]